MNLVSKEYCACRVSNDGVLILSEFAGSAVQLQHAALLVNPNHTAEMAHCLRRALEMPISEQHSRMNKLRGKIKREDIFAWRDDFYESMRSIRALGAPAH